MHSSSTISKVNLDLAARTNNSVNIPYSLAYTLKYGPVSEGSVWQARALREHYMCRTLSNPCHFQL
jgi:hypothetical protein